MREADLHTLDEIIEAHGGFGHLQHLELAWTYLCRYSIDEAADAMITAIRHVAQRHGAEDKFHETITRAWLHLVAVHSRRWSAHSFEGFIERNPALLDARLIQHFYSPELIRSGAARASWSAPDLHPLPALA